MFCCIFVLFSGTEVRFVSGVGEEVDEGYLETDANLVSVVSTLSPFSFSCHHFCHTGLIHHVPNTVDCCLDVGFQRIYVFSLFETLFA